MRLVSLCIAIALVGCPSEATPTLSIDLRTDFVPGRDFDGVRIYIGDGDLRERYDHVFSPVFDYWRGARVATHDADVFGEFPLEVELLQDGVVLASREVSATVANARSTATVVITRNCTGIECPGAAGNPLFESCLGGQCVDPRCTPETPEFCPPNSECETSMDCPTSGCFRAECVTGACLAGADDALCDPGEVCLQGVGCVPVGMDAGVPDGGPTDAGRDASGPDAPVVDGGPDGSSPPSVFCEETFPWAGGATHRVVPGESIQEAIDAAAPGDTIVLADGEWIGEGIQIDKRLRLKAENPRRAVLSGMDHEPIGQADRSLINHGIQVVGDGASGTQIEGLHVRWFLFSCFRTTQTSDVTFVGNRGENCKGEAYFFQDARNPRLFCSESLAPYAENDPRYEATVPSPGGWISYMTWGVRAEGVLDGLFTNNYFLGITYAGIRIGAGSSGYQIRDNTFNGFGVGISAGHAGSSLPPFPHTGLSDGADVGNMVVSGNTFRPAIETRFGTEVQYFGRTPFNIERIATGATITVEDNTVELADAGVRVHCPMGEMGESCGRGTVALRRNLFNGLGEFGGAPIQLGGTLMFITPTAITDVIAEHLTFAHAPTAVLGPRAVEIVRSEFYGVPQPFNGAGRGRESNAFMPAVSLPGSDNRAEDSQFPGTLPTLREARVETFPDHTARDHFRPGPMSPARQPGYVRGAVD